GAARSLQAPGGPSISRGLDSSVRGGDAHLACVVAWAAALIFELMLKLRQILSCLFSCHSQQIAEHGQPKQLSLSHRPIACLSQFDQRNEICHDNPHATSNDGPVSSTGSKMPSALRVLSSMPSST